MEYEYLVLESGYHSARNSRYDSKLTADDFDPIIIETEREIETETDNFNQKMTVINGKESIVSLPNLHVKASEADRKVFTLL